MLWFVQAPITSIISERSDSGVCGGIGLSCIDSKAVPVGIKEFDWVVAVVSGVKDIVSASCGVIGSPLDLSFDVVWEVVYGSSCALG